MRLRKKQQEDRRLRDHGESSFHSALRLRGGGTRSGEMQIVVETLGNSEYSITVNESETVEILKAKIENESGVPSCHQRLIFQGKQLTDEQILRDCNVLQDSRLTLVLKLRGG